jgi:hypothetical protein
VKLSTVYAVAARFCMSVPQPDVHRDGGRDEPSRSPMNGGMV